MAEDIRFYLLGLVNKYRAEHGLSPLHLHEEQSAYAKAHSEHRLDRIGEVLKGPLPWHADPHLRNSWAENVGYYETHKNESPEKIAVRIFDGWIGSEPHRSNLLGAKKHAGIDVAFKEEHDRRRMFMTARLR